MSAFCGRLLSSSRILLPKFTKQCSDTKLIRQFSFSSSQPQRFGIFKLGLVGVTVGALVGTGYSYHQLNKATTHIVNDEVKIPIILEVPEVSPSKQIRIAGDNSGLQLTLYQYQTCPFCCKVRAFLDYYGISYDIVEVDPVLRQAIKWSPYRKVPILVAKVENEGYQPLNDSSMIISAISTFLNDDKDLKDIVSFYPYISYTEADGSIKNEIMNKYFLMKGIQADPKENDDIKSERKWRKWVDDVFVHTLSPNVYRTWDEALQAFNWFSQAGEWEKNFPAWERYIMVYVGASAMYLIAKRLKKKYHLKDDVRQSLYDECNNWWRAVKSKGRFMGGDQPNLADLAVYGVLSSIEGCDAFDDLLRNTKIGPWYNDVKQQVINHAGAITV